MPSLQPLSGPEALDRYFLESRARLLELAANLDRVDRGGGATDPRRQLLDEALKLLLEPTQEADRAARLQLLFSRPYDPNWTRELGLGR
ncbi:MAG TPA: hypothetical protein PKD86_11330 [Gemmatales bacterium]|nr:hypothetical protein [Gemmatales bacterium]HMP59934.1 hypothetical protein [Gemmatales bacterium]